MRDRCRGCENKQALNKVANSTDALRRSLDHAITTARKQGDSGPDMRKVLEKSARRLHWRANHFNQDYKGDDPVETLANFIADTGAKIVENPMSSDAMKLKATGQFIDMLGCDARHGQPMLDLTKYSDQDIDAALEEIAIERIMSDPEAARRVLKASGRLIDQEADPCPA